MALINLIELKHNDNYIIIYLFCECNVDSATHLLFMYLFICFTNLFTNNRKPRICEGVTLLLIIILNHRVIKIYVLHLRCLANKKVCETPGVD